LGVKLFSIRLPPRSIVNSTVLLCQVEPPVREVDRHAIPGKVVQPKDILIATAKPEILMSEGPDAKIREPCNPCRVRTGKNRDFVLATNPSLVRADETFEKRLFEIACAAISGIEIKRSAQVIANRCKNTRHSTRVKYERRALAPVGIPLCFRQQNINASLIEVDGDDSVL
jgi:hypothetical protein